MSLLSLIVAALISEAVWETLKMTWQQGKVSIDRIGALTVGIVLAFVTGLDMLKLLDLGTTVPYVGIVLTGILISRGANFMHDLLNTINNIHITTKQNISEQQK